MLHGFNFSKLVLLSTLIFMYSNASSSQLFNNQGLLLQVCGAHPIKLVRNLLQIVRWRENHKKRLKD